MEKKFKLSLVLCLAIAVCVLGGVFLYRRAAQTTVFSQSETITAAIEDTNQYTTTVDATTANTPFVPPKPPPETDDTHTDTDTQANTNTPEWIPILRNPDIFYDPSQAILRLGEAVADSVTVNYFFTAHTVTLSTDKAKDSKHQEQPARRVPINDGVLREIAIDGPTLTLVCERGRFLVHDAAENMYRVADPKDLYGTIVVIDPGHGGRDEGAVINGVRERDINLDIVLRLLEIFDDERVLLLPTRIDNTDISKDDRYALANDIGDYFLSVHNNVDEHDKRSHGTKTYYHPHESDVILTSEAMALIVQQAISTRLGSRDRGIERSDVYRVLINTTIPAVLAEVMFLTNEEELARLTDPACRQEIALALAEAIHNFPVARSN